MLALEWRRVDFDAEQITPDSGTTKSGEPRTFPFTSVLRAALKTQRKLTQHLQSPLVFCHVDGWRAGRRISYGGWLKAFRKARAAAGTGKKDGRWHSIRVDVKNPSYRVRARRGYVAS